MTSVSFELFTNIKIYLYIFTKYTYFPKSLASEILVKFLVWFFPCLTAPPLSCPRGGQLFSTLWSPIEGLVSWVRVQPGTDLETAPTAFAALDYGQCCPDSQTISHRTGCRHTSIKKDTYIDINNRTYEMTFLQFPK